MPASATSAATLPMSMSSRVFSTSLPRVLRDFSKEAGTSARTSIDYWVEARYPQQTWQIEVPFRPDSRRADQTASRSAATAA
jgi:hypothetical protein